MRGRNTEDFPIGKDKGLAKYQGKQHVFMKFCYKHKHIVFNPFGEVRRKKEISEGVQVVLAIFL